MQPGSWNYLLRVGYFYAQLLSDQWSKLQSRLKQAMAGELSAAN